MTFYFVDHSFASKNETKQNQEYYFGKILEGAFVFSDSGLFHMWGQVSHKYIYDSKDIPQTEIKNITLVLLWQ